MSWGQAAEGASSTGSGASAAGGTGGASSIMGNMSDVGSGSTQGVQAVQPTSGFSLDTAGANTGQGPTVAAGNVQTYGTETPSFMQQAGTTIDRFQKGGNQNLAETYKNFGNNAETYGAAYGMVNKLGSTKQGGGGAAPITTNISYQQPVNPYLAKRGRL